MCAAKAITGLMSLSLVETIIPILGACHFRAGARLPWLQVMVYEAMVYHGRDVGGTQQVTGSTWLGFPPILPKSINPINIKPQF